MPDLDLAPLSPHEKALVRAARLVDAIGIDREQPWTLRALLRGVAVLVAQEAADA